MTNYDKHTHLLIENYLTGKLSGDELYDFEIKMSLDKDFEHEVRFQQLLNNSIRYGRRQQLLRYIEKNASTKLEGNVWGTAWTRFSVVIIVLAGILFLYSRSMDFQNRAQEETTPLYTPAPERPAQEQSLPYLPEEEIEYSEDTIVEEEVQVRNIPPRKIEPEVIVRDTTPISPINTFDRVEIARVDSIRRDMLLKDTTVVVGSPQNETGQRIKVEFWNSPINYNGYKFYNNTLSIFGFQPSEVEIRPSGESYILKVNGREYHISEQRNFSPLESHTQRRGR